MKLRKILSFRPDVLGAIFCALACLSAAIYLAGIDSRHRYEAVMSGQALAVRALVDARLEQKIAAVRALTLDPVLDNLDNPVSIAPHAQALIKSLGGRLVILSSRNGQMVFDTLFPGDIPSRPASGHPVIEPFFASVHDTLVANRYAISDLELSPRVGQYGVIMLVPIIRQGGIIGAAGLIQYHDQIVELLRPTDVPERQFATLLDGRNRVIDRSRNTSGQRIGWPLPQWMSDAMAGKTHGVLSGIGMSGIDNMMAYQQLSVAPRWHVIVGEPNALVNDMFWKPFVWVVGGGLCAVIALSWWILAWRQRFVRDTDILVTQQERLTRLFRTMPAVQFLGDVRPDGQLQVSYIGGDFKRVTGRSWEEADTTAKWERLCAPDSRPLRDIMQAVLREGSIVHEFRLSQPDGSWRWLRRELTRIALNPDGSGEVVGYIINVDDTRKAQQQALSSVHLSSVGKITASLAAELRRPLAAAHIATEILELELASDNTECAEERLALIKDKISYVIRVHDQLQRFARDRGYAHSLRATSIDEVVTRTLDVVAPALHEDRIDPVVNIPPLGCPRVLANAVDLEQVLTCLILNARDAIVVQGVRAFRRVSIHVIPSPATGTVSIKISDNGGGLPADVMSHLFEPFVTTKKDAGNIGLDLAICNALMMRMGGAIDARNDDGGAVFTIVLPAASHDTEPGVAAES